MRTPLTLLAAAVSLALASTAAAQAPDVLEMSLEQLMEVQVVSASRQRERLQDAPATIIVITADDLRLRGYRDLSEVFDDLPGMDLSRGNGDNLFRNQWRGLRKTISVPYLLLLDSQPLNHLYFNQDEIIAALPMASIERVEVVYGPAAVIYGANAFVGVINVISKALPSSGQQTDLRFTHGSFDREIADMLWQGAVGEHRWRVAARVDRGDLDPDARAGLVTLSDAYYRDRRLWGAFADSSYGGRYSSPHQHEGLDLRWQWRQSALSVQYLQLQTGYGTIYAADAAQTLAKWREPDLAITFEQAHQRGDWSGTTALRYRESGVGDDSYFVEGYNIGDGSGGQRRVIDFSYWGVENRSLAISHDSQWTLSPRWSVVAGARIEHKDLQKAYRTNYGPSVDPATLLDLATYAFPPRADFDTIANNRIDTRQASLYGQLRYQRNGLWFDDDLHTLTLGVRRDQFSAFDDATTFRGGYVVSVGPWTAKLLFGQSYNEPAPRELYGGWRGSGSDPDLSPETGDTRELHLAYNGTHLSGWASAWQLHTRDDIIAFRGGATNLGARNVRGVDIGLHSRWGNGDRTQHLLWGYASFIDATEERPDLAGTTTTAPVGDTAERKFYAGWTWTPVDQLSLTLRGRHVAARDTVASNPLGRVPSYTTLDAQLLWAFSGAAGWEFGLGITNLADRDYAHPGLRSAAAGDTPGVFDSNGVWQGSPDFYNSLLPQEGRSVTLSLRWSH